METSTRTFEKDVIERSKQVPVVVDFWAPWCSPCRQLGPILEKLANESQGRFVLVKLNTEQNPDLAAAFGIQSIPLVVAFRDGKPVNQFMGLLPEENLRDWLATFLPGPADELLAQGEAQEAEDAAAAESTYRQALEIDPANPKVKTRLARTLLAQERVDECRAIIEELERRGFLEPEAERIKSQLDLRASAEGAGDITELRQTVDSDPANLSLKLKLADALAVAGQYEEALQLCLEIIQRDKANTGVEAKDSMLKIFDMLGNESELVSSYRRKLATALY